MDWGGALVVAVPGDPDAAAFAAGGLGHEAELVFAGNGGGVDLDETRRWRSRRLVDRARDWAEPVQTTELVDLPKMAPLPPVQTMMASAGKVRVSMERRSMAVMPRQAPLESRDGGEELPAFVLGDLAFGLVAADLLVERVEELLARWVAPAKAVRW